MITEWSGKKKKKINISKSEKPFERFLIDICDISFLGFDKSQLKKQQLDEQTKEILSMFIYM